MGFWSIVEWWEGWQLRLLVLSSLFFQYFLAFTALLRKRSIPASLRFCIWLAYLGSDAVAIYSLATLFNRHRNPGGADVLEVLWAPVLLLHLSGQDGITAYNIEDNELWRRQVITVISQVMVAIYVFCKSWSGEPKLLAAAILFFIAGTLKCIDKPMTQKNSSINSMVTSSSSSSSSLHDRDRVEREATARHGHVATLEAYIQEVNASFDPRNLPERFTSEQCDLPFRPFRLFVDISSTYAYRLTVFQFFLALPFELAYKVLQGGLCNTFDRLYTKKTAYGASMTDIEPWFFLISRELALLMTFTAIGFFHVSNKEGYSGSDVKVTYVLLCCTAALEFIAMQLPKFIEMTWPGEVAQYNLVASLAREKKPTNLLRLAGLLGCKDYVDQHWYVKRSPSATSSLVITRLVIEQVLAGWIRYIDGPSTYWMFNDRRGQLTLQQLGLNNEEMLSTLEEAPFDESVLVWHLATDICFFHYHHRNDDDGITAATAAADHLNNCGTVVGHECGYAWCERSRYHEAATRCRVISNYMLYLLVNCPDMLMAGTRASTFSGARKELRKMFRNDQDPHPPCDQANLTREIHRRVRRAGQVIPYDADANADADAAQEQQALTFTRRASSLAGHLLSLDGETRWCRVIQGVWVEMLCFSASRCRGYLHAKSLGMGGEYLSYVWLLLSHLGLETVAERQQRSDLGRRIRQRPEIQMEEEPANTGHLRASVNGDDNV